MILPTKHIQPDRALLGVGAEVLAILDKPKTVTKLWDEFRAARDSEKGKSPISYDWFILTLSLNFIIGAVDFDGLMIKRNTKIDGRSE